MDWDARFGAFRQLLHTGVSSPRDRAQLLDLIDDAFHDDADRYLEQWSGYAASLHLDTPVVIECASVSAFLFWSQRVPFARFDVAFGSDARPRAALDALASSPHLDLVRSLSTSGCFLAPATARRLARLTNLSSLEVLDLRASHIKDDGLGALLDAGTLDGLVHLDLTSCGISLSGARRLAQSSVPSSLTHLELSSNPFGPEGVLTIAASCVSLRTLVVRETLDHDPCVLSTTELERLVSLDALTHLKTLHVAFSYRFDTVPSSCIRVLADAPLTRLSRLELGGNLQGLDLSHARELFTSPALPALVTLPGELLNRQCTRSHASTFLATPRAQSLQRLHLPARRGSFMNALAEAQPLESLRELSIVRASRDDLDSLARWEGLSRVRTLDLSEGAHDFTDDHLRALIASPYSASLRALSLPHTMTSTELPEWLADSPALEGLEALHLGGTYLGDVSRLHALCNSSQLTSLRSLTLADFCGDEDELDLFCSCEHLSSLRALSIHDASLSLRHLTSLRRMPWFERLESLELVVTLPWARLLFGDSAPSEREIAALERASEVLASVARGPLPQSLSALALVVLDHEGAPLDPGALTHLLARPELSHHARHLLTSRLTKKPLNALARSAGFKRSSRLDRYPLIEALRRFIVARGADSA